MVLVISSFSTRDSLWSKIKLLQFIAPETFIRDSDPDSLESHCCHVCKPAKIISNYCNGMESYHERSYSQFALTIEKWS